MQDYLESSDVNRPQAAPLEDALQAGEQELVRELIRGLRTIRYGSIVLTVHEGRLVEINKSVRIRSRAKLKE